MDKKLLEHENATKQAIKSFKNEKDKTKIQQYYEYHLNTVRDLQHERFIHLIVTLFFAGLLIVSTIGVFYTGSLIDVAEYGWLNILLSITSILLLVTEVFYIRHYYRLENGVQRLYKLSDELFKLLD